VQVPLEPDWSACIKLLRGLGVWRPRVLGGWRLCHPNKLLRGSREGRGGRRRYSQGARDNLDQLLWFLGPR
jgi:hypothetical protein